MTTPLKLYMQTMPYILARFGLALLLAFFSGIFLLICLGLESSLGVTLAQSLGALIQEDLGDDGPRIAMLCIWLAGTLGMHFIIMHYAGYLLKAGHIAVVSEILVTGVVPNKQLSFGKQAVLERFGATHAYLALDRLMDSAIGELCKAVSKLGETFENVPGAGVISGVLQLFLRIALGHVDECCMALTFYRKGENAFKAATDSVVLYFQNWKTLVKNAATTTLVCCVLYVFLGIISFIVFGIFIDADEEGLFAAFVAVFFFLTIKVSFIDSWVMIKMVAGFFEQAKNAEPSADLYAKLTELSGKFKEMLHRSEAPVDANGESVKK